MAIFSSETRISSFMEIGRIRKGAPKSEGLKDLEHFRVDFRPDQEDAARAFRSVYGDAPTSINVRLAFPQVDRCWMCYFMVYNTSGLLGKAGIIPGQDGLWWLYLRSHKTGELLVKDGFKPGTSEQLPFDPSIPVYSYKSKKTGEDVPVYAKPEGRLFVMVPELRRINFVTLLTHSWYDCARLDGQLHDIQEVAERMGLSLPAVPLRLVRRKEIISIAHDGKKRMAEKWLIHLDVDQDWSAAQFKLLDQIKPGAALPAPRPLPALPPGVGEDDGSDESESEEHERWGAVLPTETPEPPGWAWHDTRAVPPPPVVQEQFPWPEEPAPQPDGDGGAAVSANPPPDGAGANPVDPHANGLNGEENAPKRPYPPDWLARRIQQRSEQYAGKKASQQQRGLVAMLLEEAFAPADDSAERRRAVLKRLFDAGSLNDLDDALVLAMLNNWLCPKQDPGGKYSVSAVVVSEIISVYEETVDVSGL